jgi:hypothetical protein
MIPTNREKPEPRSRRRRPLFIQCFLAVAFAAATVPVFGGDENPPSANEPSVVLDPLMVSEQSETLTLRDRLLGNTSIQRKRLPIVPVPAVSFVPVLPPLTVNCPGTRNCAFAFTATAQIGSNPGPLAFWTIAVTVDDNDVFGSDSVVGTIPQFCCEQRTAELIAVGIAPGPHEVRMWVFNVSDRSAFIALRTMVTRLYAPRP